MTKDVKGDELKHNKHNNKIVLNNTRLKLLSLQRYTDILK